MLVLFAEPVLLWFRDDADVVRIGAAALRYGCFVMPFMAYSTYVNQLYQCLGFSREATLLASCRQGIFYLPLILVLPALLGISGVEMTQAGADLLTFLVSIPFQLQFYKKIVPLDK